MHLKEGKNFTIFQKSGRTNLAGIKNLLFHQKNWENNLGIILIERKKIEIIKDLYGP